MKATGLETDGSIRPPAPSWRDGVVRRCRESLSSVIAASDRLALIRTLTWLQGGRIDLAAERIQLQAGERELLDRFGLRPSADGASIRLSDAGTPRWWPSSLDVDPNDRREMLPGSADAVLRRFTSNLFYRSQAQKAAVRALLTQPPSSGLMASMPTGAGKSLLFQLAARRGRSELAGSCVAVITPTVALALDHERSAYGLPGLEGCRALTGDQAPQRARAIVDAFRRGEVPVLFLSPEAALRREVADHLVEAARATGEFGLTARLTHLFVDEAHIVESWGRSFRPDFQRLPGLLGRLRAANPELRLVLLSATLSPAARNVLREGWRSTGPWLEIDARVPRYEYDVVVQPFSSAEDRRAALGWVVDRVPRPTIVYTTEVDEAEDIHRWLANERGYHRIALFTGDTPAAERRSTVEDWARDEFDLVVATSAFGMGVDKADVRSVVHACLPEGAARWYQEIGRAARDGGQGVAALLFTSTGQHDDDVQRARRLATGGWLTRDLAQKRWEAILRLARSKGWQNGLLTMTVDLDAVRDGLRPRSSDYNRVWNMALLTLLQRAKAIDILSVAVDDVVYGHRWEVCVLDDGLLQSTEATWDRVFRVRQAELGQVRSALEPFVRLVQQPTQACVTRGAFELIEPASDVPPCGRCPHCRAGGIAAPRGLTCGGLEAAWSEAPPYAGPLPQGALLVDPIEPALDAGLPALMSRLVWAGMEQFIVPRRLSARIASLLADAGCRFGLVLTYDEWSAEAVPARLPTVLLLPPGEPGADAAVQRVVAWAAGSTWPIAIVSQGSWLVAGRRLDQWVSRHAPIPEYRLGPSSTEAVA